MRNVGYRLRHTSPGSTQPMRYIGIDGEGVGRAEHRYVLLAASTETGSKTWAAENTDGLTTVECLNLILSLPQHNAKIFAFSFNYDLTMMLHDLDNRSLYHLFRPELRARQVDGFKGPIPIEWEGYSLNLQGSKFTVAKRGRRVVIWDIWKFYQSKFVNALVGWKVGSAAMHARMSEMKDARSTFDRMWREDPTRIREYCLEECRAMAELAHKLIDTHRSLDLKLTSYYGAGSSGSALLNAMAIREKLRPVPDAMHDAVARAFFGGRFENSVIGLVNKPVYNYDISSAYPYQLTRLPCLVHGMWEHSIRRAALETARNGLVRYSYRGRIHGSWAPLPFRMQCGSICYPSTGGGGWVYLNEYLWAEADYPEIVFNEAWIYHSDCDCKPFEQIPKYYLDRCRLGKEVMGLVLKLGMNSCYGKIAQSVGNPIFANWIWAGLITSGCRAQLLELMNLAGRENTLMVATDGLFSTVRVIPPTPQDTGTMTSGKPLGGWEEKLIKKGLFIARPGIYFPLNPTADEIKEVRARGIGKSVVLESWKSIVDAFETCGPYNNVVISQVTRFCGAKTSVHRGILDPERFTRANGSTSDVSYGQWISRTLEMCFDPLPKRERILRNGKLALRVMPAAEVSAPYGKTMLCPETIEARALDQELEEQPTGDFCNY